ncbi:hypothetical protein ACHAQA_005664 [Verticillium albo-atrum]
MAYNGFQGSWSAYPRQQHQAQHPANSDVDSNDPVRVSPRDGPNWADMYSDDISWRFAPGSEDASQNLPYIQNSYNGGVFYQIQGRNTTLPSRSGFRRPFERPAERHPAGDHPPPLHVDPANARQHDPDPAPGPPGPQGANRPQGGNSQPHAGRWRSVKPEPEPEPKRESELEPGLYDFPPYRPSHGIDSTNGRQTKQEDGGSLQLSPNIRPGIGVFTGKPLHASPEQLPRTPSPNRARPAAGFPFEAPAPSPKTHLTPGAPPKEFTAQGGLGSSFRGHRRKDSFVFGKRNVTATPDPVIHLTPGAPTKKFTTQCGLGNPFRDPSPNEPELVIPRVRPADIRPVQTSPTGSLASRRGMRRPAALWTERNIEEKSRIPNINVDPRKKPPPPLPRHVQTSSKLHTDEGSIYDATPRRDFPPKVPPKLPLGKRAPSLEEVARKLWPREEEGPQQSRSWKGKGVIGGTYSRAPAPAVSKDWRNVSRLEDPSGDEEDGLRPEVRKASRPAFQPRPKEGRMGWNTTWNTLTGWIENQEPVGNPMEFDEESQEITSEINHQPARNTQARTPLFGAWNTNGHPANVHPTTSSTRVPAAARTPTPLNAVPPALRNQTTEIPSKESLDRLFTAPRTPDVDRLSGRPDTQLRQYILSTQARDLRAGQEIDVLTRALEASSNALQAARAEHAVALQAAHAAYAAGLKQRQDQVDAFKRRTETTIFGPRGQSDDDQRAHLVRMLLATFDEISQLGGRAPDTCTLNGGTLDRVQQLVEQLSGKLDLCTRELEVANNQCELLKEQAAETEARDAILKQQFALAFVVKGQQHMGTLAELQVVEEALALKRDKYEELAATVSVLQCEQEAHRGEQQAYQSVLQELEREKQAHRDTLFELKIAETAHGNAVKEAGKTLAQLKQSEGKQRAQAQDLAQTAAEKARFEKRVVSLQHELEKVTDEQETELAFARGALVNAEEKLEAAQQVIYQHKLDETRLRSDSMNELTRKDDLIEELKEKADESECELSDALEKNEVLRCRLREATTELRSRSLPTSPLANGTVSSQATLIPRRASPSTMSLDAPGAKNEEDNLKPPPESLIELSE